MKNLISYLLSLLVLACLLQACQKQQLEEVHPCQSIAYVIDKKDDLGNLLATDTSICWPQVCGEELARFQAMNKEPQPICGQPGAYIRLVIWTASSTTERQ